VDLEEGSEGGGVGCEEAEGKGWGCELRRGSVFVFAGVRRTYVRRKNLWPIPFNLPQYRYIRNDSALRSPMFRNKLTIHIIRIPIPYQRIFPLRRPLSLYIPWTLRPVPTCTPKRINNTRLHFPLRIPFRSLRLYELCPMGSFLMP
jgi:hypothetical protein